MNWLDPKQVEEWLAGDSPYGVHGLALEQFVRALAAGMTPGERHF